MSGELTHFDDSGAPRMVDITPKDATHRLARARATVRMRPETLARIGGGEVSKGDVLHVARIAGIVAAKRTADLIPLCHPLRLSAVEVEASLAPPDRVVIETVVRAHDRTGVEMEALVAASTAALTVYDMCKAIDRWMSVEEVVLLEKRGGKSGEQLRPGLARQDPQAP
ncbi:MAG: cyclic pyranopterin monophosphate synthase MoaC [Planctomycetota bacterium]|nr:MAG: cyclic pyranopterin monophosphate synthase MoaC [Planctomycetota bacterium]